MSERVIEKVNWPLWILVAIVVNVLANIAQAVLNVQGGAFGCLYTMGISSIPFTMPTLALILPLLAYLIKFVGKTKLSTSSLIYLYILGLVSSPAIATTANAARSPVGFASKVWRSELAIQEAMRTLWWVPPESAVAPTWGAGGPVDWITWLPAMLYIFLFHLIVFIMVSSQMAILRRRWIEVEKVPFPFAIAIWGSIRNIYGFEEARRGRKAFLVGMIISIALFLQIMLTILLPWWPDIIGWRILSPSPFGCVDAYCPDALRPVGSTIVAFMRMNIQPINYAIAYLAPLDILFTAWLLWIVFMVVSQVAYVMGYYTGALGISGMCRSLGWQYGISPNWHAPLYLSWMCMTGGMLALIIMIIWHSRSYLGDVFKAALGKPTPQIKEMEVREPVSYRVALILLGIGCILFIAFLSSLQIDFILGSIVFIFGGFIYPLADAYSRGLTGFDYAELRVKWPGWPVHLIWSRHPGTYTPGWCNALLILHWGVDEPSNGFTTWSEVTMHSFRLADLSGVNPRNIYKMLFIFLIIAYAITLPFKVYWAHFFGARYPHCLSGYECDEWAEGPYNTFPPSNELIGPIIMGFIIVVLLSFARSRFAWWPLHPMGFLISGSANMAFTGAWTNFLVAWIFKWATLKIGGSKAYEDYGIPFASGILAGFVIVIIVGIIVGLVRWFIPF